MTRILRVLFVVAAVVSVRGQNRSDTITPADLAAGLKNAERWMTFSGDYTSQRHSPLAQITPSNVAGLKEQWVFDSGLPVGNRGTEATPLFFGGRLYVTGLAGHAWALDARTGQPSWTYRREYPSGMVNCCGAINRGFGALGDTLYMGTIDARLIALNVKDGTVLWEAPVADASKGYSVTMAPLVVKDKVIVGVSGSEFPTRGFIDAYNARTGNREWRFYTVPAPGEPGQQYLVFGRCDGERRRRRVGRRQLRSGSESRVLRHRAIRILRTTDRIAWATTCTPARSSRWTPTPENCAGIINLRRTICTTGMPLRYRCWRRCR